MIVIRGVQVNDHDLNQRFQNTFVELSINKGAPEVVHVRVFDRLCIHLYDARVFKHSEIAFVREFPRLGAVEWNNHVHFLSRLPIRQWSRGLNRGVISDFVRGTDPRFNTNLDWSRAKAIYNPTYTPLKEGLDALRKEEKYAFARNRTFWFSGSKERIVLWYEDVPLGELIKGDKLMMNSQSCIFAQEVKDEFGKELPVIE